MGEGQTIGDEEEEGDEEQRRQQEQDEGAGAHPSCRDCLRWCVEVQESQMRVFSFSTRHPLTDQLNQSVPHNKHISIEALKARAWAGYLRQCDAEMTARLQRKNMQVVDRLGRVSDYQRCLLQTLRDNRHRMSIPLFRTFQAQTTTGSGSGSEDVETPLYYCRCIVAARPATLYVTYGHLFFISRLPGFSLNRRLAFRDVRSVSLSSLRLGIKLAKAIEVEAPPARSGAANEVIAFSSTTEPERLIELVKLLMSIHAEAADADGDEEGSHAEGAGGGTARMRQAL